MAFFLLSTLRGVGRPTGRLNAELLLRTRRSIAASRRTSSPHHQRCGRVEFRSEGDPEHRNKCASPRRPHEMKRRSMLCHNVRARAATRRFEFPTGLSPYSSTSGASARVTVVTCGLPVATQVRFTVAPTVARLPSASKGAHSRRCAGSVSACQTFFRRVAQLSDENERPFFRRPFVPAPRWPGLVRSAGDRSLSSPCLPFR